MKKEDEDEAAAHWGDLPIPDVGTQRTKELSVATMPRKASARTGSGPSPDGRSLRATQRTAQLNVKMRPDIKAKLDKIAKAKGSSQTGVIEWLIEKYWSEVEQQNSTGG